MNSGCTAQSWPIVDLGSVTSRIRNGLSVIQSSDLQGIPITRIETISDETINPQKVGYASIQSGQKDEWFLEEGDILFSHINSEAHLGKCALYTGHPKPLIHGMNLLSIKAERSLIIPEFLLYLLRSPVFRSQVPSITKRAVNQASLSIGNLKTLKVPLPPLSEQRRVVEILDQADALRKKRAEADAKAERILPALFYKMFGDPATNPKGLRKEKLGDLIKVKSGNFLPAKNMAEGGKYPVYGGNGVNGYHSDYMFDKSMIVIGRVGVYCGAVHYSEPKCWVTDNALYVAEMSDDLDERYLAAALRITNLNQYAGRAGQPLISGSRIYPVEILVPPKEDQERYAAQSEMIEEYNANRSASRESLETLFSVLLSRAFSGDLTAKWRESHMKELLAEMEEQATYLMASGTNDHRESTALQGSLFER